MTSMTSNMDIPPSPGVPRLPETKLDLSLSFDSFIPSNLYTDPEVDTKYATFLFCPYASRLRGR